MALDSVNELFSCIKKTNSPLIAGIDEAGRGPAIGPMVYGLYVASPGEKTNFRDSKLLSPEKREYFFKGMDKNYSYYKIDPVYITTHMEAGSMNLNQIAKEAVIKLLKDLLTRCPNIKTVYIDGLGNNEAYKAELKKHFTLDFVIENKADSKYQVVSGASIVAKVIRDRCVEPLGCGSGYPSDPITQKWLIEHSKKSVEFPKFVRHSWATIKNFFPIKKSRKFEGSLNGFYTGKE